MKHSPSLREKRGESISDGEFAFTRHEFEIIARTLHDETGIRLAAGKESLVYSRLAKRIRALGLESFQDYCTLVGTAAGADERAQMIAALTTNVTRFFREDHHFRHLKERLLPLLLSGVRTGKRIRIWSAGCSSGQEPYSIALTILSLLPDARSHDIRILATDINPYVLEVARKGQYSAEDIADVPAELRRTWMEPAGGKAYRFDDAVRNLVNFRELNLMEPWPMRGTFDAIFCRNVVIYFDEQTQAKMWNRMTGLLTDGGVLYVGHSERVNGPAQGLLSLEATTTYRKPARGAQ